MGVVLRNEKGAKHCDKFFVGNVRKGIVVDDSLLVSVRYNRR